MVKKRETAGNLLIPCCNGWIDGLALDAAGGKAAGQVLLDGHEHDQHGDDGEEGSGEEVLPLDDVVAVEDVDTDGQRLEGVGMKMLIPTVRGLRVSVEIRHRATVYSFQALMKMKISVVTIPGAATGSRTLNMA